MNIDDFVKQYNGQFVDVDLYYGAQCWDIVELYAEQVLQIPKNPWAITLNPDGVAKNAWLYYDQNPQLIKYFDKIQAGQEAKGDINIYDGHGVYTEGHINIELGGQVFEQNADPDHSPSHISTRSRTYLLGSLRKKGQPMPEVKVTKEQIQDVGRSYFWEPTPEYLAVWVGTTNFQNMWYDLSAQPAVKAALAAHFAIPPQPVPPASIKILGKGDYRVE